VHVPFCRARCQYCAFTSTLFDPDRVQQYVRHLLGEIELAREHQDRTGCVEARFDTIYFGGGTPSLLHAEHVRRVIDALRLRFTLASDLETTLEINPATIDVRRLKLMSDAGVNRASLGVQSLVDEELRLMGRNHTADQALTAFADMRDAEFDNISVDLIAGFPGQTVQSVAASLRSVMELRPEHLSIYLLEVKDGSRLARRIARGEVPSPDDDLAALMYEKICGLTAVSGYEQYEIANFSLPGRRSRHNLKYWQDRDYLGFGAGAHGLFSGTRYANHEQPGDYQQAIESGELPRATVTKLSIDTRFREALIMGLRLVDGIDPVELGARYRVDVRSFVRAASGDLEEAGLMVIGDDRIVLTPKGRLLSNMVFTRFV
jgi:oxygen-independent coproporphyrinogen III oxidase